MKKISGIFLIAGLITFSLSLPLAVKAQDGLTLSSQEVSGYMDSKGRNPLLTITIKRPTDPVRVTIQANASITSKDFQDYPIRYDFYVNRKLFSSQIQSKELPGPVGVDIGSDIATPPFNYSVVATIVHPNRQFTSMIQGAVFEGDLAANFDCTLTLTSEGTSTSDPTITTYTANAVSSVQAGNNLITLNFTAKNAEKSDEEAKIDASLTVNASDSKASGTVNYSINGESKSATLSGDTTVTDGTVSSLSIESEDGSVALSCS